MSRTQHGVIFDMDGVLVDSSEAHFAAWSRLGEELGVAHPREVFESTFGMHNRQIIPLWLGGRVAEDAVQRYSDRKEAIYRELAATEVRPLDGVVELIQSLHANGFRLAVGSSGPRPNVELILGLLGVKELFHALSTGDEVTHGKPNPEVFLKAADKLGCPPERCVVIEDAPQGVEAGVAAGAKVIAVTSTRPASELSKAHVVIASLRDVSPDLVARLFQLQHGSAS
jgi:beta-phosphoglucomutase